MNEHIEKLALAAGMRKTSLHYGRRDPYVLWEDDIEKFAQSIVSECAGIYDAIDNGNTQMGTDDYLEALRLKFRS
jgi:hypothetical protein